MGQLQTYLWAESMPMVFILILVALIETIAIALFFAMRSRNHSFLWLANPMSLFPVMAFFVVCTKSEAGCWLLLWTTVIVGLLLCLVPYMYTSSEGFRKWVNNDNEERNSKVEEAVGG
jgi:hypothetical protein